MADNPGEIELLARLIAAEQVIARAIAEAGIDLEVAAAACAAMAGEYTAAAAVGLGMSLAPLLREAVGTLRRRGIKAHQALRPGPKAGRA